MIAKFHSQDISKSPPLIKQGFELFAGLSQEGSRKTPQEQDPTLEEEERHMLHLRVVVLLAERGPNNHASKCPKLKL
jgi:hypothetical protein